MTALLVLLSNCPHVLNYKINIIFDDLGIWLLGYMVEFSCLYIPQRHYFISTLWLLSTDEYTKQFNI